MARQIADLKERHDPEHTELMMRHQILQVRKGHDEQVKQRLMPIVRPLVQKVVIGKTPGGNPPAK